MAACDLAVPGLRRFAGFFRMFRCRGYQYVDGNYSTRSWQALFHRKGALMRNCRFTVAFAVGPECTTIRGGMTRNWIESRQGWLCKSRY